MFSNAPDDAKLIVLMSHYNDNENLKKSLLSFDEPIGIDVLIVDDGSRIKPDQEELQALFKLGTLTVVNLEENLGCGGARNRGLEIISKLDKKYPFIGTMDSDDLNKKDRYSKQIQYLEENTETKLIGAWLDCVDSKGNFLYTHKYPVRYEDIKKQMYINSMFAHPTLVFRSEILEVVGFYPVQYRWSEDYAFLFNVCKKFKVENYPEALIYYTIHENAYSSKHRKAQVKDRLRIIWDNFYFGLYPIYGLLRNYPLIYISREFLTPIKKMLRKN